MQVSTFLWFDGQAEAAATHYTALFPDSKILDTQHDADGHVITVVFALAGQRYVAYNGAQPYPLTGAISMYAECESQQEVDTLWTGLTDGGKEGPGGSLVDRFGVTWQVIPTTLQHLLKGAEPETAGRILAAVHAMTKIDIQGLVDARDQ
ncbi:VOC family protein [Microlunatus sp. GCM10028923]|uniref:VOC family protein n=1 Tax=Microlunatus sp. GCM10028923 TaxID=3273400 RepID=UPI0036065050